MFIFLLTRLHSYIILTFSQEATMQLQNENAELDGFTKRILMSMVVDMARLCGVVDRLQIQISTMAEAHEIIPPTVEDEPIDLFS